jgi:1-acyl-sn-glycerol-3-phosphate acyltransferase
MFYTFILKVVSGFLRIANGKPQYYNLDRVPAADGENYVLVAPHRTYLDPVFIAIPLYPKRFVFMAKKELFKNKLVSWFLKKLGAFPVDREKPGPSAVKIPVKALKETHDALMIFPSGTRHSSEMKGGAAAIAKMAKVKLLPVVDQGPLSIGDVFKRQTVHVNFGDLIDISDIKRMNEEGIAEVSRRMEAAFDALDDEIDPEFRKNFKIK